jgi:hypothetical protein
MQPKFHNTVLIEKTFYTVLIIYTITNPTQN